MARKIKKKSKARKITKRAVKKSKRTSAPKTKVKKVAMKPHKAKTAKTGKLKKKAVADAATVAMENMPYDLGYHIP
jgi:hypothetical protein